MTFTDFIQFPKKLMQGWKGVKYSTFEGVVGSLFWIFLILGFALILVDVLVFYRYSLRVVNLVVTPQILYTRIDEDRLSRVSKILEERSGTFNAILAEISEKKKR